MAAAREWGGNGGPEGLSVREEWRMPSTAGRFPLRVAPAVAAEAAAGAAAAGWLADWLVARLTPHWGFL